MKQRITYLLPDGDRVESSSIKVKNDSLHFARANEAAQEWRLTLGWDELPIEIQEILEGAHELHFRWSSPKTSEFRSPLVARVPAGLHAFFTPRDSHQDVPLCDLLIRLLGFSSARCHSVSETFTRPSILSERFANSASYQYYHYTTSQKGVASLFLERICADPSPALSDCKHILDELKQAAYVDVDYDAISHAVVLTAFWPSLGEYALSNRASRSIRRSRAEDRIEVGILNPEVAKEPEQLSLGGFLTVIGDDDHPSVTLFSFPARHHPLPATTSATYRAQFQQPSGLHPKLDIVLPREHLVPPKDTCALHAYWTLPSALFVDRYQLSDPLFLASQNLIKLHSLSGEQDLEAPNWVIDQWGSTALLQLATPPSKEPASEGDSDWTITIPTHLRYLTAQENSTDSGHAKLEVPWPIVFWACEAEEGLKMSTNPFDRVNLGYDGLFGPKTMFYHIPPAADATLTVQELQVPVLDTSKARWVSVGTMFAVLVGLGWVCWQLLRTVSSPSKGKKGNETKIS